MWFKFIITVCYMIPNYHTLITCKKFGNRNTLRPHLTILYVSYSHIIFIVSIILARNESIFRLTLTVDWIGWLIIITLSLMTFNFGLFSLLYWSEVTVVYRHYVWLPLLYRSTDHAVWLASCGPWQHLYLNDWMNMKPVHDMLY